MIKIKLFKNGNLILEKEGVKNNKNLVFEDIYYDPENHSLVRENKDYKYLLDFINEEAIVELKEKNVTIPIGMSVIKKDIDNNKHIINYKIDSDEDSENLLEIWMDFK